jgi:hypothetical protein
MGGIVDEWEVVCVGDRLQAFHIASSAPDVYRNNARRTGRNRSLNKLGS